MFLFLLAACSPEEDAPASIAGTVTADSGESAELTSASAFGVRVGDVAGLFIAPNADADCGDVADYLGSNDPDFNPEVVSGAGVCSLYVRVDGYTGEPLDLTEADMTATLSLNCAMDEGVWETEDRSDEGWYYTGPWWVGSPDAYTLSLEGGNDDDFTLTVSMDTYTGRFPYDEVEPDADPATGTVAGTRTVTWCDDLAPAFD